MRTKTNSAHGFTLIEISISIAAAGILFLLVLNAYRILVIQGADPLYSMRAAELGQSYLEEILGKRFAENSPLGNALRCGDTTTVPAQPACSALGIDSGETAGAQNIFDDVDDYSTLTQAVNAQPRDQSNNVRSGYENFHVVVTVVNAGGEVGLSGGDAKRIDVTIIDPAGAKYLFSAYKTNF